MHATLKSQTIPKKELMDLEKMREIKKKMSARAETKQSKNTILIYSFFPKSRSVVNFSGAANDFHNQHLSNHRNSARGNEDQKLKEGMKQIESENLKLCAENHELRTDFAGS